ncbi:divalent-cation tolerance protein CutA [bacterium]|nr:divalent-cation tolerance protein CutA [bacterium]
MSRTADFKAIGDWARQIGTHLLEKQLVACVNALSPCASVYPCDFEGK